MRRGLLVLLGLAIAWMAAGPAHAGTRRFAIVIGANSGNPDEVHLRYAESDARRLASILRDVGGFGPEDLLVLTNTDADEVRDTLIRTNARIREAAGDGLLFVFYSGHADAESLHISGTRMPLHELEDLVTGSSAQARILVLDACRSGAVTRIKGGRPGPAFAIDLDDRLGAEGVAILTSSAAGEDAQESDTLRASFFTHYLASGLIGAADNNGDGDVSLAEAFTYASERTLAATVSTVAGPQHPTFRFDLGGREDLVLTRPGSESRKFGALVFPKPGTYLVHRGRKEGDVVAELTSAEGGGRLALAPGRYFVVLRARDHLREGTFAVVSGDTTEVELAEMKRLAYAQVVRKGGTQKNLAVSPFVVGGVRGDIRALGGAVRTDVGTRMDFRGLTTELRVGLGMSEEINDRLRINSREVSVTGAALKAFDLRWLTLSAGIEGGGIWFNQRFHDPLNPDRNNYGLVLAPVAQVQVPVYRGLHVRLDGAALTYFVQTEQNGEKRIVTPVTYRATAGLGWSF